MVSPKTKNNMKNLILLLAFAVVSNAYAQKFYTKTGFTEFKASVEAFEPVEANNNSTTALLNTENGDIAALLFIKAFNFRVALMQEHFNENYMDSDKFPKATFKGSLNNFDFGNLQRLYQLQGVLNIRGIDKDIETPVSVRMDGDKIRLEAEFNVSPSDFDIKIPSIVEEKISETITISLNYELVEKK